MTLTASDIDTRAITDAAEPGDHDKFAHYVPKRLLTDALVFGYAVEALCGKRWVPTRDGLKFPVCPECQEEWEKKDDD